MPERIQRRRSKGWRMPPNTVCVTRHGRWGNPAEIGKPWQGAPVPDAATAVAIFRDGVESEREGFPRRAEIQGALRGKNLACFCKPDQPCHADVLLELANN
jgi:hypothetical protein